MHLCKCKQVKNKLKKAADSFDNKVEGFYPAIQIQNNLHWFVQTE